MLIVAYKDYENINAHFRDLLGSESFDLKAGAAYTIGNKYRS